jgi:hypothetical protein
LGLPLVTWATVADKIILVKKDSSQNTEETKRGFAGLWGRLATDYLDPVQTTEYNSMKHGLRIEPGGFHLAVGLESVRGQPAPSEQMKPLGGSQFGTSFFMAEQPAGSTKGKGDPNFRIRSMSLNWNPESLALRLHLIAVSLGNTVSFLKFRNGVDPASLKFDLPEDVEAFWEPWKYSVGVLNCSIDTEVREEDIRPMSKKDIMAELAPKEADPNSAD